MIFSPKKPKRVARIKKNELAGHFADFLATITATLTSVAEIKGRAENKKPCSPRRDSMSEPET